MRPTTSWRLPSAIDRSAFDRFTPFCDFRRRGPQWRLDVDLRRPSPRSIVRPWVDSGRLPLKAVCLDVVEQKANNPAWTTRIASPSSRLEMDPVRQDTVFLSDLPGDVVWLVCDKCCRKGYLRLAIAQCPKAPEVGTAPQYLRSLRGPLGERNDGAASLIGLPGLTGCFLSLSVLSAVLLAALSPPSDLWGLLAYCASKPSLLLSFPWRPVTIRRNSTSGRTKTDLRVVPPTSTMRAGKRHIQSPTAFAI